MISYLDTEELATRIQTLTATMIAAGDRHRRHPRLGRLTDKIGRRPVYLAVTAIGIVWGIPMFLSPTPAS